MSEDINVTDGTILEALNGKIDYDGGNYLGSGLEEVVNNYLAENTGSGLDDKITNCLLEVPQRIKLELADGVLTLKAGSEIILSGEEYKTHVTTEDQTFTFSGTESEQRMVFVAAANGAIQSPSPLSDITSGNGAPTDATTSSKYYDYTNRLFYYKKGGVSWVNWAVAYPIGIVTITEGVITSIDQVFNGMGCIGSTIWVDKGVKGLIPNGRNEDGTLNNTEFVTSEVLTRTYNGTDIHFVYISSNGIGNQSKDIYDKQNNINDNAGSQFKSCLVGTFKTTNGVISNFQPKQPFRAVDYNDKSEIISWGMPDYNSGIAISQLFTADTSYTAPSDGVIVMLAYKTGSAVEFYINGIKTPYSIRSESQWVGNKSSITIPISKGDVIYCSQTANSSVKESTFYPLKGVK